MYIGFLTRGEPYPLTLSGSLGGTSGGTTSSGGGGCGGGWYQVEGGQGAHVNGSTSNIYVQCYPWKRPARQCGRASASMVIHAYTGEWLTTKQVGRNWAGTLETATGMRWPKRNYKADGMAGVINYLRKGYPVIIYYHTGKSKHIVVATQYDAGKDAFRVVNSLPKTCRTEWISRSYFLSHPHSQGHIYRAPAVK